MSSIADQVASMTPEQQQDFKHDLQSGCKAYIPGIGTDYGYVPSLAAGIVFCVLFGLCIIGHSIQGWRKRQWTSFVCAAGALVEVLGWAGRTWSAKCPYSEDAFLMQITTLIIAPTFFSAAAYVVLGALINICGRQSSILSPRWYLIIFCTADVLSLVIQAIGGGMASTADQNNEDTAPGTDVMVAGIVFQMFTMTVFVGFLIDFLRRAKLSLLPKGARYVMGAMVLSVVTIYIRSIYRTIELVQGWSGYLITHQRYFIALDGSMMVVAVAIYLIPWCDPAVVLPPGTHSFRKNPKKTPAESRDGHTLADYGSEEGKDTPEV